MAAAATKAALTATTHSTTLIGCNIRPESTEHAALLKVASGGENDLRALYVFENNRVTRNGVGLEGAVYEYAPHARIGRDSPLIQQADRLFGHVLVAPIMDGAIDETAARRAIAELAKQTNTRSDQPFSLSQNVNARGAGGSDAAKWSPELGHHGHFIGL